MKILKNPWKHEFLQLVASAEFSIKITSPFVKKNICEEIYSVKNKEAKFELITTFKLANVYNGSLDMGGIEHILSRRGIVKNYPRLHSKIYIFDDSHAVVTSGNLTNGGLTSNFEYGIFIDEQSLVNDIVSDFTVLSTSSLTGIVKKEHIHQAKNILSKITPLPAKRFPEFSIETPEINFDVFSNGIEPITSSLSGWKLDVFICINQISGQELSLEQVYRFEKHLRLLHPKNNKIKDKIRQQLQELRDLGLLEFLGKGRYRKLWM
ncbi:MAG: phospholipase D-like domain-containing protein [Candidatus Kapabacteria bacterium]|jgi:hypothetical protein|nr:phospholipase D-like domain-containing protein [Candidatus Kapabacteria bacterium]